MEASDSDLLNLVVDGDSEAWNTLVDRHSQAVWNVTGVYGLDDALRQDILQTVWLRLFDRASTIRNPSRLVGWLCTIARNEAINIIRHRTRMLSFDETFDRPSSDERLLDLTDNEGERMSLAKAFTQLDQRCRELLALCIQDPPLHYRDIATSLDVPVGSIGPTRRRCLDKLRRMPTVARLIRDQEASK